MKHWYRGPATTIRTFPLVGCASQQVPILADISRLPFVFCGCQLVRERFQSRVDSGGWYMRILGLIRCRNKRQVNTFPLTAIRGFCFSRLKAFPFATATTFGA